MARQSRTDELFDMLRARGLRRRAARALSDAASAGRTGAATSQQKAMSMVDDLRRLADELEDRLTGGGKAKSRTEAAKKAARTRQRKATARSAAAKKGAATRAKRGTASGGTRASSSRSSGKRSSGTRSSGTRSSGTRRRSSS